MFTNWERGIQKGVNDEKFSSAYVMSFSYSFPIDDILFAVKYCVCNNRFLIFEMDVNNAGVF